MRHRLRILIAFLLVIITPAHGVLGSSGGFPVFTMPAPSGAADTGVLVNQTGMYNTVKDGGSIAITYTGSIGGGGPELIISLDGYSEALENGVVVYTVKWVTVRELETGDNIFTDKPWAESDREDFGFRVVDLNFDGFLDIMFINETVGAHGSYTYRAYLWNPKGDAYEYCESFSDIVNATVDPACKAILSIASDSAFDTWYGIYTYAGGMFTLEAELATALQDDVWGDGEVWQYEEFLHDTSDVYCVTWKDIVLNDPTEEYTERFGPGSYWDLRNHIWYAGDHYSGYYPWADRRFTTYWHASPVVGSGFSERYDFKPDGTFIYGCSEMNSLERTRYTEGYWYVDNGKLTLEVTSRIIWAGGETVESAIYMSGSEIVDYEVIYEALDKPEIIAYDISSPEYNMEYGRYVITIGDTEFCDYFNQMDLFDGYYEYIGESNPYNPHVTPLSQREDEEPLAFGSEAGSVLYARGVVREDRFYHEGWGEWIESYYVQVSPKQYAYFSGLIDGFTADETDGYCLVQLTGDGVYDFKRYIGRDVVFTGVPYEGDSVFLRTRMVVEVSAITVYIQGDSIAANETGPTAPPVGGVDKLTAGELAALSMDFDPYEALGFGESEDITLEELAELVAKWSIWPATGDTRYIKRQKTGYFFDFDEEIWVNNGNQTITETWFKGEGFTRREILTISNEDHAERVGDTDCFLVHRTDGGCKTYGWFKSSTEGKSRAYDEYDYNKEPATWTSFWPEDYYDMTYCRYPDTVVDGHPCIVYAMFGEESGRFFWFATDLGRELICEIWDGDWRDIIYTITDTNVDRDDSFFEPPGNVSFTE